MPANSVIQFRRGTAAQWTSANPVLANGEPGYETDTGKEKRGDGISAWSSLTYIGSGAYSPLGRDSLNPKDYGVSFNGTTDDASALNTFFSSTVSAGDSVRFPRNATALVGSAVTVPTGKTGVVVDLNGSTLKLSASATSGTTVLNLVPDSVTVRGGTIDGNGAANATGIRPKGAGQRITGCKLKSSIAGGVYIQDSCTHLRVDGNEFTGDGYGILFDSATVAHHITISGNDFHDSAVGDAIEVNTPTNGASYITITGNVIANYTDSNTSRGIGIGLANVSYSTVDSNVISGVSFDGIHLEDRGEGVTISNNIIRACGREGIPLYQGAGSAGGPTGTVITGNQIYGCMTSAGQSAIALLGVTAVNRTTIIGNTIRGNGRAGATCYGIDLGSGGSKNVVIGNKVSNTIGSSTAGIRFSGATDTIITGNECWDDQGTQTQLYGLRAYGAAVQVIVSGNNFIGNKTAAIDESSINGSSTSYLKIGGNRPSGTDNYAITPVVTPGGGTAVSDSTFGTVVPNNGAVVLDGSNNKLSGKISNVWFSVPLPVAAGTATLAAGAATVSNASVTANSQIRVWSKALGGTPGALYVSAKTAGTGFTITSTSGSDTSGVVYEIVAY